MIMCESTGRCTDFPALPARRNRRRTVLRATTASQTRGSRLHLPTKCAFRTNRTLPYPRSSAALHSASGFSIMCQSLRGRMAETSGRIRPDMARGMHPMPSDSALATCGTRLGHHDDLRYEPRLCPLSPARLDSERRLSARTSLWPRRGWETGLLGRLIAVFESGNPRPRRSLYT
jgi:hypothetical protein